MLTPASRPALALYALLLVLLAAATTTLAQGVPGTVLLDSYAGATDDAKLTNALADVKTKTYIPAILLSGRTYTFTKTQRRSAASRLLDRLPATSTRS